MATPDTPDTSQLLPLIKWPDIYKDKLDYLENMSPVFQTPFWKKFIGAYSQQDTELAYRPSIQASRMKDPSQTTNDAQLGAWGLSSAGFNPDNLLGFKDFFPALQTYWGQYVKDRGTSISFIGFIEWCFNVDITYVPLSIAKEQETVTTTGEHFVAKTALAGQTEVTLNPPIQDAEFAYVIKLDTGEEIPASVVMQTPEGTVLNLAFPLTAILLKNRSLVVKQISQNPNSKLDIKSLRPKAYGGDSPDGPYYPSPYYDVYFRPRTDSGPTLTYSQLVDVLLYLKPIYLVQRAVSERYESDTLMSVSSEQAYYALEQQVICYSNHVLVNDRQSSDVFKFWMNATTFL